VSALVELAGVGKVFRSSGHAVTAVEGVDLSVAPSQVVGIVGESGSGKSTLARIVVGLEHQTSGHVLLRGEPVGKRRTREQHRAVQMVFQDPRSSLNPRMTIQASVEDFAAVHRLGDRAERRRLAAEALERVHLPSEAGERRPSQLSGGQLQRACIARALVVGPSLLVADEPTSSLDMSIQGQILNLLDELREQLAIVLITHDIAVVRHLADEIHVMLSGRVVETGSTGEVLDRPRALYTQRLVGAQA
jgi:ABC-type dipeptide/oligopeptide/nickel transport system ATPase subunit